MPPPDPLMQMLGAYRVTAALRAVVELDLFTIISKGKRTAATIAEEAGASERGVRILLDSLVPTRLLLNKKRNSYELTPMARTYLVSTSDEFMGDIVKLHGHPLLWGAFGDLTAAVKKGGTVLSSNAHSENQEFWEFFASATAASARVMAGEMVEQLQIDRKSGPMTVLDVACGSGAYGIAVAEANPQAEVILLDRANVIKRTRKIVKESKVESQIRYLEGDIFKVDLEGPYDLVILSHVLHHFSHETSGRLLKRVLKSMEMYGRVLVHEFLVDDDRARRLRQLLFSLTMLVWTKEGESYSFAEARQLLVQSGFRHVRFFNLGQPSQFVTARR